VAGALTERGFVEKLEQAGFTEIEVLERSLFSLKDAELYPLFTDDVLELMRRLLPAERQRAVATRVVVRARLA
jgi:hypothetical protein